ncbi:nicotinamide mononucleotide transporter [Blattabacterium sp. (Cryptocercus kyebangensis)]|uniref:nicotinamide riboside transporter PnuC n=1 Tax=Blattabacterium sp. (Cryptocercus kyebangensis) TaxID=298656 RepID=UPI000D7BF285|nr:nicotinamide riboside transporter PnuC [Blattabacterium sp. (Cryptocercus kyebangensis)]AWU43782.1 nicotinamide mononucleotide transporter [Blattabacterium sp. (Cryptocercus kyebangensis)]
MNEWINMFLSPYHNKSWGYIILELTAVIFSIFSVIFAQRNNIWLYPIGIFSTIIYSYLTFVSFLYGDFIINIYYTGMGFYGWYVWIYKKYKKKQKIPITYSDKKDYFYTALFFVSTCIFSITVYSLNGKLKTNYDWMDVFTTGVFFSGMYQMAMKKVENWIFWIVGNIISVPLYFFKGLILTGFLFIFLAGLAIVGYFIWKKEALITK